MMRGGNREMRRMMDKMGIDMNEIISAASTKPFGFTPFKPGPGMGGHCIPIDPVFISWVGKKFNYRTKFIDLGTKINKYVTSGNYYQEVFCDPLDYKKVFFMDTWLHHTVNGGKTIVKTWEICRVQSFI